jgi:hypothetical protein
VAPGGRVVVVVGFPPVPAGVDLAGLALREVFLVGTVGCLVTSDFPARSGCWPHSSRAPRSRIPLADAVAGGLDRLAGPDGQEQAKVLVSPEL